MSKTRVIDGKTSLFLLTWPIFVELLLQMLVGNVDQFMISRYSDQAVAAIGNVNQIMNLLVITFNILSMATTIMVAQYLGAKNYKKISEIYSVSIICNVVFGVVISGALFFLSDGMFAMMRLPQELYADAKVYINIVGAFTFLQAAYMSLTAIFRSNGLMKQSMYISIGINVINIIGNAIFLGGLFGVPQLGIMGVAISSVVSRLIGLIALIIIFNRTIEAKVSLSYLRPFPVDTLKSLLRIGLPGAGENISYSASQMVIMMCVNMMGTTAVTTKVYAGMLAWGSFLYGSAVSSANQIIIGHMVGAGDYEGAKERTLKSLWPAMGITLLMSILLFVFSDSIFGIFTDNPEVIALGKGIMLVEIFLEIGRCINMIVIRAMHAAGDIQFPVIAGIISMWGIATVLSFVLGISMGMGIIGVWIAMALDECVRGVVMYIRWQRGSWRNKSIVC
ncbi:MAG: MATE family efflux transporter [Cellulosilyticaceae bacterium]